VRRNKALRNGAAFVLAPSSTAAGIVGSGKDGDENADGVGSRNKQFGASWTEVKSARPKTKRATKRKNDPIYQMDKARIPPDLFEETFKETFKIEP
jgi:hypothetical protein